MGDSFEYNAPKFINFLQGEYTEEYDGADTFFDCHVGDTPRPSKQLHYTTEKECHAGDTLQTAVMDGSPHTSEKDLSCVSNETYTVSPANEGIARLQDLNSIEEEVDIQNLTCSVEVLSVKTPVKNNSDNVKKEKIPRIHPMSLRSDTNISPATKDLNTKVVHGQCDERKNINIQRSISTVDQKTEKIQRNVASGGTFVRRKTLTCPHVSRDQKKATHSNILDINKRKGSPLQCPNNKRFISMAEAVNRFHQNTPERFHSQPNSKAFLIRSLAKKQHFSPLHGTIPHSPHLLTKERIRPVYCLSREEEEEKELEEIKAFCLKAQPIDKKVLKGWMPPPIEKKAPTVPQPFNLTEVKKKENKSSEVFTFSARPAPRRILQSPQGIPEKKVIPVTSTNTPNVARKVKHMFAKAIVQDENDSLQIVNKEVAHEGVPVLHQKHATEICPFTFEERDRELQRKREERLQKVLEEERKAREFKANPLPMFIKSLRNTSVSSITSKKSDSKEEEHHTIFKARPPSVLYKKPFVPQKIVHPLTDTTAFELNTERRRKERENFQKQLKEREALIEEYKKKEAERKQQEEEEAQIMLRKMAVHKANPVRKYRPIDIHPSEKLLTAPNSPALNIRQNQK